MDIDFLLSELTLEEKASFCSGLDFWSLQGVERLGIPSLLVADGPHGLRKQSGEVLEIDITKNDPATCFPTASALAATWNNDLIQQVGSSIGAEARQAGVSVVLGPGINIKRAPVCGRNFEYFSEDPYLSGKLAVSFINGVQSQGVGTSLKHYTVNNQEQRRFSIDAIVDERTLREIYLAGFEMAIKEAQPWTVMCAYNKINGTYASDHQYLMRDILKDEWGHEGLVITDWGAMNDHVQAVKAGTNVEMPAGGGGGKQHIMQAVKSGTLDEAVLDESVGRVLNLIAKANMPHDPSPQVNFDAHHALARQVAGEAAVLLKNDANLLPFPSGMNIALIGRFAKQPRYQGGGSSMVNPTKVENLYDELVAKVGAEQVHYAAGYTRKAEKPDDDLIAEALQCANGADVIVLCVGLIDLEEVEATDRQHLSLCAGQEALIQAIIAAHDNVVIVLSNGSPVAMPWVDKVPAILEGYLGGQAGAGSIADILVGDVNPSGKLAETFPQKLTDTPAYDYFPGGPMTVEYRESLYVGYRYYDTAHVDVLFPFGHGLSYTSFEYSALQLDQATLTDADTLTVSLTVQNTGAVAGKEIVQIYVRDVESTAFRPDKELKGFAKVALQPNESTTVSIQLEPRAFAYYDVAQRDWVIEAGTFEILVGASSRDIRLQTTIEMQSSQVPSPTKRDQLAPYYNFSANTMISDEAFSTLLGQPLPPNILPSIGNYTINTPVSEMHESKLAQRFLKTIRVQIMRTQEADTPTARMVDGSIDHMPLRGMYLSGRRINHHLVNGLLHLMNRHYFKAIASLMRGVWLALRPK